ncbi:MAG: HD domain-containing protein, partial [Gammaproteobacteria bacterium]|nr:HD domain-containing protein [Gammaproteobacteria bacterium]
MPLSSNENPADDHDQAGIIEATRRFLETQAGEGEIAAAIAEGREIAAIVGSFGLSDNLLAAVRAYPAIRDNLIDINTLENNDLKELSRYIIGLVQLGRFSLPSGWQPGEALAAKQSEALRKMLLAVVSDVRLVLVRIAEQLYRMRRAKDATPEEQRAVAVETREIYAALANRLGVWQLKWELE